MERNWLIRTTQFQILGPVTKDKVLEFFNRGALGPEDELSTGNGYWFFVKEKDLLEKYLLGNEIQSFNPISEAPTVIANKFNKTDKKSTPISNVTHSSTDQTLVLNTKNVEKNNSDKAEPIKLPKNDDLEFPDLNNPGVVETPTPQKNSPIRLDFGEMDLKVESHKSSATQTNVTVKKDESIVKYQMTSSDTLKQEQTEVVHLPKEDDLEYPSPIVEVPKQSDSDNTSDNLFSENDLPLELDLKDNKASPNDEATKTQYMSTSPGSPKSVLVPDKKTENVKEVNALKPKAKEDRKILLERKKITPIDSKKAKSVNDEARTTEPKFSKRNDSYFFLIIILLIMIILGVLFYYQEILNKPLPV